MSEFGERLHFDAEGTAICPGNGQRYRLLDGKVSRFDAQ
jgi:hypothetical protein